MSASMLDPPVAEKRPHTVDSPFGHRADPYYWLRDDTRSDAAVLAHLRKENDYRVQSMAAAKPLEDKLYAEIISRLKQDDASVPYRKNNYWYYTRYEVGKEHPIFARRRDQTDASEQIMLDVNVLAAAHDYYQIGSLEVSPDATWLAFCDDRVGRRQFTLRFKNLATGAMHASSIEGVEPDVAWANDNRTLLYIKKHPETLLGQYVMKHVLGAADTPDERVFEQTDMSFYTGISKSKSDRFIFIHMESTVSSEWRYAAADDPGLRFSIFAAHERDHEYDIEHLGQDFIVRTNWRAPNFRLMRVPIGREADRGAWRDLVAHRADTFIEDFDVFQRFVALSVRHGGLSKIRIKLLTAPELEGVDEFFIESHEPTYTAGISVNPEIDAEVLRYAYSSLTTPATVYDYDVHERSQVLLKREPVIGGFDPGDYQSEFRSIAARDGAQVPVSLVYRKGAARDGAAPMLLYGYGAYGLSMDPNFSASRLSLLDRGFVFALVHVRGGQEKGRSWYDSGRLLEKKNSFTDFIDVTRALVASRIAAADKVFAMGGSAGGLLMGAVANMSTGDYRGIVAQVPFVDVVTTMLDESIPLTTNEYDEWGNPSDRRFYDYMLSYSPYDNVTAKNYPAMLVTTGLWDSQVQYYEPVKWVAKLRALKTDANPLLLHVEMDAGHGGKSGRFQHYREVAMEYAFILDLLGIRA